MTVDMLAATFFWPEGTLHAACRFHPDEADPGAGPPEHQDAAEAAAGAEGFWSAMIRQLWRPSDAPALP